LCCNRIFFCFAQAIDAVLVTTKEVNEVKRHSESQQRILDIQTELLKHNKEIGGNLLAAGAAAAGRRNAAAALSGV
jgi:hypothetical protein